ncbi:hypothetical protein TRIP_B220101 [uncultured Desulfatiglans sp.]|nr:hypothetical protein TRIP_B220101 [uncultured Desulfatiglans sp.]
MILYSLYKNLKTPNYNIFLYSLYKNAPYHYNPCRKSFDKCLAKKIKPFIIEPEKVDARGFYRCKVNDWDRFAEIILTHDK